jgi:aspartyl-tRNA(Asn)/glutamyl-tRNA(Gln) amidotransferase subunit B
MPEPDLPPIVLNKQVLNGMTLEEFLATTLPELPEQATVRLQEEYGLSHDVALVITGDPPAVQMYELAVKVAGEQLAGTVANWLCNDLFALVKDSAGGDQFPSVQYSRVNGTQLGELVVMMDEGSVSTTMGKKILACMYHEDIGKEPHQIAEERGWKVISNLDELRTICAQVINQHDAQLEQYKQGGKHVRKMKKFFAGKCMAHSRGNAHPELLQDMLEETLEKLAPNVHE